MRFMVRWMAAVVVGVSACGGASQQPDGGAGSGGPMDGGAAMDRGGPVDRANSTGGSGGGATDAGRPDVPLSTGDFPFPGRWWATLPGTTTDAGVIDEGPFVIHWSETDPADRGLWTRQRVYPVSVSPATDGGTIVLHTAPFTTGCWGFYATIDPDALDVRPCNAPPSAPVLGTFRRGPRLVAEIPLPPLVPPGLRAVKLLAGGIAGGGDWVVFAVDAELWFWKRDTGQVFALGAGETYQVVVSPNGRRVMFTRAKPGAQILSLLVFDTVTAEVTDLTAMVPITAAAQYTPVGLFSPDGNKVVFHANESIGRSYDLVLYDFVSRDIVTVARQLSAIAYGRQTEIFLASSDHLIYVGYDATSSISTGSIPMYGYELSTGKRISFGRGTNLMLIPGGTHAAWQAAEGHTLIDDATFTPRAVVSQANSVRAMAVSPDGADVAYVDSQGVLSVRSLTSGAPVAIASGVGCFALPDPLAPVGSGQKRSVAALFAADGAVIYNVGPGCNEGIYGLGRYDRVTQSAKTYAPLADSARIMALSPLGGFVLDSPRPSLLVWPGPPTNLESAVALEAFSHDATFAFSAADRYFTYTTNGFLMVRDNPAATVTKVAQIGSAKTFTSPENGVTVVNPVIDRMPLNAYLPDTTTWQMAPHAGGLMPNPKSNKLAFTGVGTDVVSLEPAATATTIGNGNPLAITDTQVIFRDLDGVCAASLTGARASR